MNTTCRFCNALLDDAGNCPRCGESTTGTPTVAVAGTPTRPRRQNWRIGLLVLGGMAVLFIAALIFMLDTRGKRGGRSLAEAPALGYLPADTNLIVAWNPAAAEPSKEARALMERIGFTDGGSLDPEPLVGIKRDQIDDVVIGLGRDFRFPIPEFRVVVRTKSAYDADKVREKLRRTGSKTVGAKTVDILSPPALRPVEIAMWCATPHTLVLCQRPDDVAKIPDTPHANSDHLPAQIVEMLRHRTDRDSFLWLAAHSEDWSKTLLTLLNLPADQRKTLFKAETIGLALRPDRGAITSRGRPARVTETVDPARAGVALDLVLQARSDEDAMDLRKLLEDGFEALKLDVRDSNLKETHFSATVVGSPQEFDELLKRFRTLGKKPK